MTGTAVHPRARGEHIPETLLGWPMDGSSPRSRGTPQQVVEAVGGFRFIPALAGNTARCVRRHARPAVHPPRSRGTLGRLDLSPGVQRFIPALAGNTHRPLAVPSGRAVHPRARGEHAVQRHPQRHQIGSSPRSRGTPTALGAIRYIVRFIPALAGNTQSGSTRADTPPVTSPRSRGTQSPTTCPPAHGRFIPALAGNTTTGSEWVFVKSVHPRARGEHMDRDDDYRDKVGSSPRSRGTRHLAAEAGAPWRFIPALAGNTGGHVSGRASGPVHPRARGEHRPSRIRSPGIPGSSPRSRGTL